MEYDWQQVSISWLLRSEKLTPKISMWCWRRPAGHVYDRQTDPYGWIRVAAWGDGVLNPLAIPFLEEIRFEQDSGPLELECVAHELRAKYLSTIKTSSRVPEQALNSET